jgi:hypothetical protein
MVVTFVTTVAAIERGKTKIFFWWRLMEEGTVWGR